MEEMCGANVESPLLVALKNVQEQITISDNKIGQLRERLQPLLEPPRPETDTKDAEQEGTTPASVLFRDIDRQIRSQHCTLADLLSRLEV
jgi:hypothetical protein